MGKRERERGKGGGDIYTPHTEKSRYSSKTWSIRENPRNSGKSEDFG
jgi:hypothetical protein